MTARSRCCHGLAWLAPIVLLLAPRPAAAQGSCAPGQDRVQLRVFPGAIVFPSPGPADFSTGWIESSPVRIRIRGAGKETWTLCLRSEDPDLGGGKAVGDLQWRVEGESSWHPLSLTDQPVVPGLGNDDVQLLFRVLLDWASDPPGDHGTLVAFSAPGG